MKTVPLLFTVLSVFQFQLSGQVDYQWLILHGVGKMGCDNANHNLYPSSNVISNYFNLNGVKLPDINNVPKAANDILVIFEDTRHFNTRNKNFFFDMNDYVNQISSHEFKNMHGSSIKYLYLTNRYEEDDLPNGVSLRATPTISDLTPYEINLTNPGVLSANHDVVFTKDFTLIINNELLAPYAASELTLEYNIVDPIKPVSGQSMEHADIFDLKNVFKQGNASESYDYPSGSTQLIQPGILELTINTPFTYVNFRPNEEALDYGPDANGRETYQAVFNIKAKTQNGTIQVGQLTEPLRHSHDPNFLEVISLCEVEDQPHNKGFVKYHLEFENTSDIPVNKIIAQVTMPPGFGQNCVKATKWNIGGNTVTGGKVRFNNGVLTFRFPTDKGDLLKCNDLNIPQTHLQCKGFVEFILRTHHRIRLQDVSYSLRLEEPKVYFDGVDFDIDEFKDKKHYDGHKMKYLRRFEKDRCVQCNGINQ